MLTRTNNMVILAVMIILAGTSPAACENDPFFNARYEPPGGTVYHGVGWGDEAQVNYMNMFPGNLRPLLHQSIFGIPGNTGRALTIRSILARLAPPHMDASRQVAEISVHFYENEMPVDSLFAYTGMYDQYMDTLARALILHWEPVFLRIGLEMNGPWNGYTPWIFPAAFRKLTHGLRDRGVQNLATVWCYEPDAAADFADSTEKGWKWYPGDDMVDWFGLDLFDYDHFDPSLPDYGDRNALTKKGRSGYFLQFALSRQKPVYLNELSARGVFITPEADDPDSADAMADWNTWFEPFFAFIENHPVIKAFNYIDLEWTTIPEYSHWGDARLEINSYIRDRWTGRMADPRYLHIGTDPENPDTGVGTPEGLPTVPESMSLSAYPNPFNSRTCLELVMAQKQNVRMAVYNTAGRTVESRELGVLNTGIHRIVWDAGSLPSGVYMVRCAGSRMSVTGKLIMVR